MKLFVIPAVMVLTGTTVLTSCTQKTKTVAPAAVDRNPTSEEGGETPWTTWSKRGTVGGLLVLKKIREDLLQNNLHDPHINYSGYKSVDCSKQNTMYRSADGTCTVIEVPQVGAANTAFGRNVAPEYIDADAAEKLRTPNPIEVSKEFFTREEFKPVPFLNMLAASWIQFMNHDWLTHGKNVETNPHRVSHKGEERSMERTAENPVGGYDNKYGKVSLNTVTHWWDASQIYGSNQDEQNAVRAFAKGKMATVVVNGKELLPKNSALNTAHNKMNQGHEVTGFRDNWWVGLSMLHHLFVKEHNAIAERLLQKYARFDQKSGKWNWKGNGKRVQMTDKELDEHVFQTARLINAAVMSKIHTIEWTPAILPNKTLKKAMFTNWFGLANPQTWSRFLKHLPGMNRTNWFAGNSASYAVAGIVGQKTDNYGVPYSITEEFTSVYRLHSLLPEALYLRRLDKKDTVNNVALAETRNEKSYPLMESYDLKDLFYSFGTQHPGQLVLNNFPHFMQNLTIPGLGQMDLAMVDVMRDRERGVPRYNQFRRAIGLKAISRYEDFFLDGQAKDERQKKIVEKFKRVYGVDEDGKDNVEMIDLLVGTLAEEVRPNGFGFGETQFQIFILMASRRLMADRFYTENYTAEYYTKAGLNWVDDEGYMHKVILRHMPELKPHLKGLETAFNPWNK